MSDNKITGLIKELTRGLVTASLFFVGMLIGAEKVPEYVGYILLAVAVLFL